MSLGIIRLEHIGIASNDEKAKELFQFILDRPIYNEEIVESENVRTQFFQIGTSKIELLKGQSENDAISKFIQNKGPGIHHLAFEVEDIEHAFQEAKRMGLVVLNEQPKKGADNKLIFFVHPKSTGGVLMEFCQEIKKQ